KKLQAQSNCSRWRLSQPYLKQLLDIAEVDASWLAKNYAMHFRLMKSENLPEAAPEEFQADVAKLLAKILTQTICARWSPYRFNLFARAVLFFILEKLPSIRRR
ncbi:MAG: hypothetical protein WBW81_05895, partial [Methylocella sp.]